LYIRLSGVRSPGSDVPLLLEPREISRRSPV
jgi:hypothetical protein